ncbi:hypothetical protein [Wenxinia saemankumensis]|nr:hypothetical protein [Wenxinia saemankumensis]
MSFPANVFVLCTGRCGSMTLARACAALPGWTAGHESRTWRTGADRLSYPPRHVEVDNRLSWLLGRLERSWGDSAAYVHLTRDPEAVAQSFAARARQGIVRAYRMDILARSRRRAPDRPLIEECRDYVDTVTANIEAFLAGKRHVLPMRLETLAEDFDVFTGWIGAGGDLAPARAAIRAVTNATAGAARPAAAAARRPSKERPE